MNTLLIFQDLGTIEAFVIILIAVLVFGPEKLPEIARGLGNGVRKMKNATDDIKREIWEQTEKNKEANELKKELESGIDEAKKTIQDIEGTIKRK